MDKLQFFNSCLRAYGKADRAEKNLERCTLEWNMYLDELAERGWLDEFSKFYKAENDRDVKTWNYLMSKKERELQK